MKQLAYIVTILMAFVVVGCGSKTNSNNAESAEAVEVAEAVDVAEAVEVAEAVDVAEDVVHGGLKLKTEVRGLTYIFTFYNDGTLNVNISANNESNSYEGTWVRENGSYHDVFYTWYKLKYNVDGSAAVAYIDENRRLFGPMYDGNYQTARAIAIADNSSDPLHNEIIKWVNNLSEVQ